MRKFGKFPKLQHRLTINRAHDGVCAHITLVANGTVWVISGAAVEQGVILTNGSVLLPCITHRLKPVTPLSN